MPAPRRTFKTVDAQGQEKTWTFWKPKDTGANGAGEFGGFYKSPTGELDANGQLRLDENGEPCTDKCLIKQDTRIALNIAEFLAGAIYEGIVPDVSARIKLVRLDDTQPISSDGRDVYLVSEFIPQWKSDLYTDVELFLHPTRNPERSKIKFLETTQLLWRLIVRSDELTGVFRAQNEAGNYLNYGQVAATSLLINNTDTHVGNMGVIEDHDTGHKKLGIVDYGAAFNTMTAKINPHSFRKYLSSHTFKHEGWNNFKFYNEAIKITSEFVSELDRTAATDITAVVNNAFDKLEKYYSIRPIVAFAVRAGYSLPLNERTLSELEGNPDLAAQKIQLIKSKAITSLQKRQADLSRFSAQIKMDLCTVENASKQCSLDGSFTDKNGRNVTFNDVVFDHFDYFKEIALGLEKFKFRKSTHKHQPLLIQDVEKKSQIVLASFLLVPENIRIQERHGITNMDKAIDALRNGVLDKLMLYSALNKDFIPAAKEIFSRFEQGRMQQKFDTVTGIIGAERFNPQPTAVQLARLRKCEKLQDAIIELHNGCTQIGANYTDAQKAALSTYKIETIKLALQGADAYKTGHAAVQNAAILAIDDSFFVPWARFIGNLIFIAVMTASVIGLLSMVYSGRSGRDLLLFPGPQKEIRSVTSKFNDVRDDVPPNDVLPNGGNPDVLPTDVPPNDNVPGAQQPLTNSI